MSDWDDEYDDLTEEIEGLEQLIAAGKEEREQADGASVAVLDAGLKELEKKLEAANERRNLVAEHKTNDDAYNSPLGQLASAAFRHVDYDYATSEDYPGIVTALQRVLDENGWELGPE